MSERSEELRPRIRHVEALPMVSSGEYVVCLRDPEGLVGKMLLISPEAAWAISLFDGRHTLSQISARFAARFGYAVSVSELADLVAELDELYLLWNERYLERRARVVSDFIASSFRQPFHAGLSYPADPAALDQLLDECAAAHVDAVGGLEGPLLGLVAPHIDYPRGKAAYGALLRVLEATPAAETFVILGTAHYATVDTPYVITRKSFRTPLGTIECDTAFVDELASALSWDPFQGEEAHRTEHSIELHAVLLGRARAGGSPPRMVPVLCNAFLSHVRASRRPETDGRVEEFVAVLRRLLATRGERAVVVASGDLAHVGLKFGDPHEADQERCGWVRERDLATLEAVEAVDAGSFYDLIVGENDARRICGLSPIYTLLAATPAARGRTLHYAQALEPDTGSMVSFAAVALHG